MNPDILHIEGCNFMDKPMGGQLTSSRQLLKSLGSRLALAGWARDPSEPLGVWFRKDLDGIPVRFFAFDREPMSSRKPLVPARIKTWFRVRRYRDRILSIGIPNLLISEPSILMALKMPPGANLCFLSPGLDAPLSISRYRWAFLFSGFFDRLFCSALGRKADCILANADHAAIADFKKRAGEILRNREIRSFPTRVDTDIFHPGNRAEVRKRLGLSLEAIIAVTTGRIHWAKGWAFLLDAFKLFLAGHPNSMLIFIGDGPDRSALERKTGEMRLSDRVSIMGFQPPLAVASYLQAADLFIMGSFKEGWSTSMVEALACHLPIVTTRVSSADTIVCTGINGFVVDRRDPLNFSHAMEKAIELAEAARYSERVIGHYALKNLGRDLLQSWRLI